MIKAVVTAVKISASKNQALHFVSQHLIKWTWLNSADKLGENSVKCSQSGRHASWCLFNNRGYYTGFPRTLENSGKWPFHGKSGKSQGICKAPQGILENSKISGNSQGILSLAELSTAYEKCYIVSICFALSFQISIIYRSIYSFSVYKKHKFSFKVTCDSHFIVKLALQSENVLACLAS